MVFFQHLLLEDFPTSMDDDYDSEEISSCNENSYGDNDDNWDVNIVKNATVRLCRLQQDLLDQYLKSVQETSNLFDHRFHLLQLELQEVDHQRTPMRRK